MRLLFVVLIVLNLLAFASAKGWLGVADPTGEPERLTNQLAPERIVLASDKARSAPAPAEAPPPPAPGNTTAAGPQSPDAAAASAPVVAAAPEAGPPVACVAYGGLAEKQADALVADAQAVDRTWRIERDVTQTPTAWWVRIPPEGGREGAERKVAELRTLGITDYFVVQDPGPNQFAVSLGLFKTEAKAQQHLAFLRTKRVRSASVTPRTAAVHRIEIRAPAAALASFDNSRGARTPGATKAGCNP